ncbi:HepT-like ribonuclease domain-containing protein [Herbiconiux sp.]|uniref:HepT-like ribonuclease domain-containing protein n=1 Tax=Herbiconiux sp. TaxID=1871186 RepID=UPI0025C23D0B|nr:HepT-like ribonuclease domain-containing protein [Herbiconiux sp.]
MNQREAEAILALWLEVDQGLALVDELKDSHRHWRDELAAERVVERIFQAAESIPPEIRIHHFGPEGFKRLRGMRNRLAHNYREIDVSILWGTLTDELPRVRDRLEMDCQVASAIVLAERFEEEKSEWLLLHLAATAGSAMAVGDEGSSHTH